MPRPVWAQEAGIAGTVKDASGAVMPGVTVEASSPALIERVRSVVTDDKGAYKLIDLRPGRYTVTFTLSGFATVKREGIDLNAGFTAGVDAEMKVGSLEETLTVTSASPVVDLQNVRTQNTLSRAVLDSVPNAQSISSFSALTLGSTASGVTSGADVGGNQGESGMVSIHHARTDDMKYYQDGMSVNNSMGNNGGIYHAGQVNNSLAVSEVQVAYSGANAEVETAGANFNFVTKDGGNRFTGDARAFFTNNNFQHTSLPTDLVARGLTSGQSVKDIYDYGGALGGPLLKDRLWFFTAHRIWGNDEYQPNSFFNAIQGTGRYQADTSRQGYYQSHTHENSGHLTLQASLKDKIAYFGNYVSTCSCFQGVGATTAPEASFNTVLPASLNQVTWTRVQSAKILFEAGYTFLWTNWQFVHSPGESLTDIPVTELSTGFTYNAKPGALYYTDGNPPGEWPAGQQNARASMSYVTGSHNIKVGGTWLRGVNTQAGTVNSLPGFGPVSFQFLNGKAVSLTEWAAPNYQSQGFHNLGLFAQDQWTMNDRLTLSLGVRGDFFDGWYPDQDVPAGAFVPGFHVTGRSGVPTYRDVSPRLGLAYKLTTDGKTAVKVSAGRYMGSKGTDIPQAVNPANALVLSASRTWNDANGDLFPQANELGPLSNAAFGTSVPNTTYLDNVLTANRPYTWQASASIERELLPRTQLSVGYFYLRNFNFTVTQNTAVTPDNFTTYCVTAPVNPALPGGGGNQICGNYDVNPAQFGKVKSAVSIATPFGSYKDLQNTVDIAVRTRFGHGGLFQGGISLGRSEIDTCFQNSRPDILAAGTTATTPRTQAFCDVVGLWWKANGQIKLNGSYPLPYGFQLGGVFQNLPGAPILANAVFTNAQVAASLGRNLAACGTATTCNATVTIPLIPNLTMFEARVNQLDLRVGRQFTFRRVVATPALDVYNVFSSDPVLARNNTFGSAWGTPTRFLDGRLAKLGIQLTF
jgi:hypothetical protein